MIPQGFAVILVMDPPMTRVAAHVFRMPNGIGWMEPGYLDEYPSPRPQWHQFDGEVTDTESGVFLQGKDQTILVLDLEDEQVARDYPQVKREAEQIKALLAERHTTLAAERMRISGEVDAIA